MSKIDIEVNESLVGAVLGPAGRSIVEIQQYSGAAIQISKKASKSYQQVSNFFIFTILVSRAPTPQGPATGLSRSPDRKSR